MKANFYSDEFEKFLKHTTDNFRMYPSEKVWKSLYNNIHPGRKWPSLQVLFILIFALSLMDKLNTKQFTPTFFASRFSSLPANTLQAKANKSTKNTLLAAGESSFDYEVSPKQRVVSNNFNLIIPNFQLDKKRSPSINNNISTSFESLNTLEDYSDFINTEKIERKEDKTNFSENERIENNTIIPVNIYINSKQNQLDKDFAYQNIPSITKLKSGFSYQLYATPSFGYRSLIKKPTTNFEPNSTSVEPSLNTPFNQDAAFNMEMGGNILMKVSKLIRLTAGMQLNYTNYNLKPLESNPNLNLRSSSSFSLSNNSDVSNKALNNNSYQLSIPIGADFKIAEINNIKVFAGATVQPTYIIKGNSYLISPDLKNYIEDKSLMRKGNLNGGIETFISYKTPKGIILNAGPQFRYQFFSTYTRQYNYDEKLYNLGIKLGVSKSF